MVLEKGLEQRDPNLLYFAAIPWFKKYQSDPRWNQIDEKIRRILSKTKLKRLSTDP